MRKLKLISVFLSICGGLFFFVVHASETQTQLSLEIFPGALRVNIVDENYVPVPEPYVLFSEIDFSFMNQETNAILGTQAQNIWVENPSSDPTWEVTIAATKGPTALWVDDEGNDPWDGTCPSVCVDYNSGTGIGQLTIDPTDGYIYREDYGDVEGIVLGPKASFIEGSVNDITLFRSTSGEPYHAYSLTGVKLKQTIPGGQRANRSYTLDMTLTIA